MLLHLAIQFIFSETSLHSLEELELQAGDENKQNAIHTEVLNT